MRETRSALAGFRARKAGDSGRKGSIRQPISKGSAPPTTNSPCQPKAGMTTVASRPEAEMPTAGQASANATTSPFREGWTHSVTMASVTGRHPPKPKPARARRKPIWNGSAASAISKVQTPNSRAAPTSTGFRPSRSPRMPPIIAPIAAPA